MSLARGNICQWTDLSDCRTLRIMNTHAVAAGTYLQLLRERKELIQQDIADFLTIDVRTVKRWERGENRPGVDHLSALMAWLEGETDEFAKLWEMKPGTTEDAQKALERTLGKRATRSVNNAADSYADTLPPEELAEIIDLAQRLSRERRVRLTDIARRLLRRGGRSGGK